MSFETIRRVNYASAPSCGVPANTERDFKNYHLPLNRLQNRLLHGPGVLGGLEPSATADGLGVVVSPGVALDGQGRTIVLSDDGTGLVGNPPKPANSPVIVPLPSGLAGPLTLTMTVEYAEDATVPIDAANPTGCRQIEARPRFRLLPSDTPPGVEAVVLGVVEVGADGKVAGLDPASRTSTVVTTSGLKVERIGPGSFTKAVAAELVPATDGGAQLGVPDGPLTIQATKTEIRATEHDSVALHVAGSLAVSDAILLGEPGVGIPLNTILDGFRTTIDGLERMINGLKDETADLRRALAAPVVTTVWASAVTATVQNTGQGSSSVGVGLVVANVFPGQTVTFKLAVPVPAAVAGRSVTLRRIFVTGANTSPFLGTVQLFDGIQSIQGSISKQLIGDFSKPMDANTFNLDSPHAMTGGLLVQLECLNELPVVHPPGFPPFGIPLFINLIGIGAEFVG